MQYLIALITLKLQGFSHGTSFFTSGLELGPFDLVSFIFNLVNLTGFAWIELNRLVKVAHIKLVRIGSAHHGPH